jgi:hypothetical protein
MLSCLLPDPDFIVLDKVTLNERAREAVRAVVLTEAAYRSAETGQTVQLEGPWQSCHESIGRPRG